MRTPEAYRILMESNRKKAAWAKRKRATDPEWRERQKRRWRERYYRLKEAKCKNAAS